MTNLLDLKQYQILKSELSGYKKLILDKKPIKNKDDFFMAGLYAIYAGAKIFDEFLDFDSKNEAEFEETKETIIKLLSHKIQNLQSRKFKKAGNLILVDFEDRGNRND